MSTPTATTLPALAVTGVGSLPHTDPAAAIAFVAAHTPVVPFWPQLPRRDDGEGMLRQTLGYPGSLVARVPGAAGFQVTRGRTAELIAWLQDAPSAIIPAEAAAFGPFQRALRRGDLPDAQAVKGQLIGPATLAAFVQVEGVPASEHPALAAALRRRVTARAAWQVEALAAHGLPVLLVVDEPVLGLPGAQGPSAAAVEGVRAVLRAIRDAGAVAGLHTCALGPLPWSALGADLWSLDLHGREGLLPAGVRQTLADGAYLAAGLVPTDAGTAGSPGGTLRSDPGTLPAPAALSANWLAAATAVGDVAALAARTVLTPTCGVAGLDIGGAAASFARAAEVADCIRTLVGGIG